MTGNETFWIFGYGSLMSGGWKLALGSLRHGWADVEGFARAFNKASTLNWGSKLQPGPTLNLVKREGATCRGIAFEFPVERRDDVLAYLEEREGKAFPLRPVSARLSDGRFVTALVPIYEGRNIVSTANTAEIATMVKAASGVSGRCADYVIGVAAVLQDLGINDPAVDDLMAALKD